jgi:predicted nucleic acid-binding protein
MISFAKKYINEKSKIFEVKDPTENYVLFAPDDFSKDYLVWWDELYQLWLNEYSDRTSQIDEQEIIKRKEMILKLGIRR